MGVLVRGEPCAERSRWAWSAGAWRVRQGWELSVNDQEVRRGCDGWMAGLSAPIAASRCCAIVGPLSLAPWWLAGVRDVITAAVACAGIVLIGAAFIMRRRLIRAASIRSVLSVGGPLAGGALRDVLRRLTGDPVLEVYYRLPSRQEYVTPAGELAPWRGQPNAVPGRQLIRAGVADGDGFTALVDAAAPSGFTGWPRWRDVLRAAAPALENIRLQATLRRQVMELDGARSRTVRAFLAERRRLEDQLHDGTQACLFEARSQVRKARDQVSDAAAAASIDAAAATLNDAITELGGLVRGIYPAGLREAGLGSALFTATNDLPLVVKITDDAESHLDEITATAGFFTVMDVLYAAARAGARAATVAISAEGVRARLRVDYSPETPPAAHGDSGPDEADAWLAAEDRVRAMDGTMRVMSAGTAVVVEVELPCAS
jgi:signal transduction histidine kinase